MSDWFDHYEHNFLRPDEERKVRRLPAWARSLISRLDTDASRAVEYAKKIHDQRNEQFESDREESNTFLREIAPYASGNPWEYVSLGDSPAIMFGKSQDGLVVRMLDDQHVEVHNQGLFENELVILPRESNRIIIRLQSRR